MFSEMFSPDELPIVATLLLDMAAADGEYDPSEVEEIRSTMRSVSGGGPLPREVIDALHAYDPDTFDPAAAIGRLTLDRAARQTLMALLGSVVAADGEFHEGELARLEEIAPALGYGEGQMERFLEALMEAIEPEG